MDFFVPWYDVRLSEIKLLHFLETKCPELKAY